MKKQFNQKAWLVHGTICLLLGIACFLDFRWFILWNLGYALYFTFRLLLRGLKGIRSRFQQLLFLPLLSAGAILCAALLCIPSVLLSRIHSLRNPEYARDLPICEMGSLRLANGAWYKDCNNCYFEGDIPEKELKKASLLQNWHLLEIEKEEIVPYTAVTKIDFYKNNSQPDTTLRIRSGLIYRKNEPDGSGISVIWDREKKRLYVWRSFR